MIRSERIKSRKDAPREKACEEGDKPVRMETYGCLLGCTG
jgi:hypothetical protein